MTKMKFSEEVTTKEAEKRACPYKLTNPNEEFDPFCESHRCMAWRTTDKEKEIGFCYKIFGDSYLFASIFSKATETTKTGE